MARADDDMRKYVCQRGHTEKKTMDRNCIQNVLIFVYILYANITLSFNDLYF